jgi:hypothetical protein
MINFMIVLLLHTGGAPIATGQGQPIKPCGSVCIGVGHGQVIKPCGSICFGPTPPVSTRPPVIGLHACKAACHHRVRPVHPAR